MNSHQRRKARRARDRRILAGIAKFREMYPNGRTITGRIGGPYRPPLQNISIPRTPEGEAFREAIRRGRQRVRERLWGLTWD